MSSPFTFPSPFPPPFIIPSPSPLAAPSPLASILGQFPGPSPSALFPTLLGLGGGNTPQPQQSLAPGSLYGAPAPSSRGAGAAAGAPSEVELDTVLGGMESVLGMLGRLEAVLEMIQVERRAVFEGSAKAGAGDGESIGGIGGADGSPSRIMSLQQEYAQILLSLQPLLTSTLLGALPVPLSSALPVPLSSALPPPASGTTSDPSAIPTIPDLTAWAESRAELEFSRREGVRAGAKAVLDTLRTKT